MAIKEVLSIIPSIGDGLSWATQKIIHFIAMYGINLTILQSKLLLVLIFGASLYIVLSVLTIAKKFLKWGLIILLVLLLISVVVSIFA